MSIPEPTQTVLTGDCLTLLPTMADQSIDVIVTSPPYNIGLKYSQYQDDLESSEYLVWLSRVSAELKRVLKPNGSFFLNIGSTSTNPWIVADVASVFRRDFVLQNQIAWIKSISIGDNTVGHFKPISSKRFLNQNHETIFHFTHTGAVPIDRLAVGVPYKDKSNIGRRKHSRDRRCAGNVWYIPYRTVQSRSGKFNHPAAFPVGLAQRCIELHAGQHLSMFDDSLTVLDPFLGSGTTLVAARQLGHTGIGIELDPKYAEVARQRIAETSETFAAVLLA